MDIENSRGEALSGNGRAFFPGSSVYRILREGWLQVAALQGYLFPLSPVFLAMGVGLYFSLLSEPPLWIGGCLFGIALIAGLPLRQNRALKNVFLVAALIALGFAAAQIRTHTAMTPVLAKDTKPLDLEGTVAGIEDAEGGDGYIMTLRDIVSPDLEAVKTPRKIRLTMKMKSGVRPAPGDRISLLARLLAPSPPVFPGGFDMRRYFYFQGIGATGFGLSAPEITGHAPSGGLFPTMEALRQKVTTSIQAHMEQRDAAIAAALMIGRRKAVLEEDNEAMRASGLAHLLAISGMNIGFFAGVVFFVARLGMVCIPGFNLRHPVKKYAAAIGALGVWFYVALAEPSIPTQRALIMTVIIMFAIIIDRSPLSLRLLSVSAFILLLFFPESLLSASFQMSFGAVCALIVFFEATRKQWMDWYAGAGMGRKVLLYLGSICVTTVIASLATTPFSLYHFQQTAVFALPANMVAVPLMGIIIMPCIVSAFALMPFGLEGLAYYPMESGIRLFLYIAHFTAGLPGAVLKTPVFPLSIVMLVLSSVFIALFFRGFMRLLAFIPLMFIMSILYAMTLPNVLISPDSGLVMIRDNSGETYFSGKKKGRFIREEWLQALGETDESPVNVLPEEGSAGALRCDPEACRAEIGNVKFSFLRDLYAMREECAAADIVIAHEPVSLCPEKSIDLWDTSRNGSYAVYAADGKLQMENAREFYGQRPWTPEKTRQ